MLYEIINKGFKKSKCFSYDKHYFGYFNYKEFISKAKMLQIDETIINFFNDQNKIRHNYLENGDNFCLSILVMKDNNKVDSKIALYITNNLFIFINLNNSIKVKNIFYNFLTTISYDFSIYHLLSNLIDYFIKDLFNELEYIENRMINIEQELFENEIYKNLNPVIFSIKKKLIEYKRQITFYSNIINNFSYTKNKYLYNLENKLSRLNSYIEYLIQNTIHLREIYQSYLDFYQNRVIKMLTIVTTIFLPLTLITSWYGMNLKYFPEREYEYSYPIIIVVCLTIIIIILIIFKKKKII